MAKTKKKHKVVVKTEYCKGCNMCIEFCKPNVFRSSLDLNKMGYNFAEVYNTDECNGCMVCVLVCPDLVLEVYSE